MIKVISIIAIAISTLMGCDHNGATVYRAYVIEDPQYTQSSSTVVVPVTPTTCPSYLETHYTPYYHTPTWCTDYGVAGRCCTWTYFDGYGDCSDEWCFWEDTCNWEPIVEECVYEAYEYYYPY